jgi:hypothetical protein
MTDESTRLAFPVEGVRSGPADSCWVPAWGDVRK